MANEQQLALLKQGVDAWNKWREEHSEIQPDLREANLGDANLSGAYLNGGNLVEAYLTRANLDRTYLSGAKLSGTYLIEANLRGAYLIEANLSGAYLRGANLCGANLSGAYLKGANLCGADLSRADLSGANLSGAYLKGANLCRANLMFTQLSNSNLDMTNLSGSWVYGISAWRAKLEGAKQLNLIISRDRVPTIMVDTLEVAQLIGLLLNTEKIFNAINTITSKVVLILGCFTPERRAVLNTIRGALRQQGYLPVLIDFQRIQSQEITEIIPPFLVRMAQFIIADLTDAKRLPQELKRLVPQLSAVPVQLLAHVCATESAILEDFKQFSWVETYRYGNSQEAITYIYEKIVPPAESQVLQSLHN